MANESTRTFSIERWVILLSVGVLILLMLLLTVPHVTLAQTGACKTVVIRFRPSSGVKPGEYPWGFNLTWDAQKQKYFGATVGSAGGGQTVTATVGYGTKGVSISAESGKCSYTFSGEAKGNNLYEGDWRGSSGCAYGTFQAELQGCSSDGTLSGSSSDGKPPVAGTLGVGHSCSYNEPSISPGQLRCAATATNAPANAKIEYSWKLDGVAQSEKTGTFTRADKDIAPGSHTLIVVAKDTTNNTEASSSYSFTKAGADLYLTVQCALRAEDDHAVACYADPKNLPDGTTLTYEWTWGGIQQSESGRTLSKSKLADGAYNVTVRARDNKTGKYTTPAFTSITVGKPFGIDIESIAAGINSALTGTPMPRPPDPVSAAAAGAAISVLLGAGALANARTSRVTVRQTTTPGAQTQTAPTTDGQQPSPTDAKPTDLPEQSEAETDGKEDKKDKPDVKPDKTPPRVFDTKPPIPLNTKTAGKDKPETPDKSDAKDKPTAKPDTTPPRVFDTPVTATAKPTTMPEQKPSPAELTPEEWSARRQQAVRVRQEGMKEARSEYWEGVSADILHYGTKYVVQWPADLAIDFLANFSGPPGRAVKFGYSIIKNIAVGVTESKIKGEDINKGIIKGGGNAALDYLVGRAGERLRLPNPGIRNHPLSDPASKSILGDRLGDINGLDVRGIMTDRSIIAGIRTAESEVKRFLIKDPIKVGLGLKGGKPWQPWTE